MFGTDVHPINLMHPVPVCFSVFFPISLDTNGTIPQIPVILFPFVLRKQIVIISLSQKQCIICCPAALLRKKTTIDRKHSMFHDNMSHSCILFQSLIYFRLVLVQKLYIREIPGILEYFFGSTYITKIPRLCAVPCQQAIDQFIRIRFRKVSNHIATSSSKLCCKRRSAMLVPSLLAF